MKHTLAIFAAFAALAASAITTTLEYEDARETLTRAAVSNDLAQAVRSATNTLAQALAEGSIEVRAATARFADEADEAGVAGMAHVANGLYGENSERTADEIFTSIDAAASTNDVMLTPIYSQTPTFSEWTFSGTSPSSGHHWEVTWDFVSQEYRLYDVPDGQTWESVVGPSEFVINIDGTLTTVVFPTTGVTATRTRTDLIGYQLGSQTDKLLQPKGDYARVGDITNTVTKTYVNSLGISASDVGATTPADVTDMIRAESLGGIWDPYLEVWWTPVMANGSLTYQATTNVNLNAGH